MQSLSVASRMQPPPFRAADNNSQTHSFQLGSTSLRSSTGRRWQMFQSLRYLTCRRKCKGYDCAQRTRFTYDMQSFHAFTTHPSERASTSNTVLFRELSCSGRDNWALKERGKRRVDGGQGTQLLSGSFLGLLLKSMCVSAMFGFVCTLIEIHVQTGHAWLY